MKEHEDFITTFTGKKFHFLDPKPGEIDIRDIAHHLSLKCRFTGACKVFYSVAEHSIRVAEILPAELLLSGLLHDSTEAYMPDVPRPIKEAFGLRKYENIIMDVIAKKYGLTPYAPEIKIADDTLIATEGRDLMPSTDGWMELPEPLKEKIVPVSSQLAEVAFLARFRVYGGKELKL